MRTILISLLLVGPISASTAPGRSLDLAAAKSKVEFLAIGRPSMLKIRGTAKPEGEAKALEGALKIQGDSVTGSAKFALDSLDTGMALRNRHMKEKYLETSKYPKAEFSLTDLRLPAALKAGDGAAKDVPFKGTLTVHGVAKPVEGKANIERKAGAVQFEFTFSTRITSHSIELPSFMGVTVAEEVEIRVAVEGPLT
jgi:polyisoprenoid-binding protein YceI